jgi:hypothetical protein
MASSIVIIMAHSKLNVRGIGSSGNNDNNGAQRRRVSTAANEK